MRGKQPNSADVSRVCPPVPSILPPPSSEVSVDCVKEEPRDHYTLPAMGSCDLGPVAAAVLGGGRVPAPALSLQLEWLSANCSSLGLSVGGRFGGLGGGGERVITSTSWDGREVRFFFF